MLLDRIKKDLKQAMLNKDENRKDALRIVLGEIPRLNKKVNEVVTDKEIETIIRKLIKSENEMQAVLQKEERLADGLFYINILKEYVPKLMSETEICKWMVDNVDKGLQKNQAMGFIMKNLKGKADGSLVKKIVDKVWD